MKQTGSADPYENLAAAIIVSAVKDYKKALRRLKRNQECKEAIQAVKKEERFFYSSWFRVLTDTDPCRLIRRLKEKIDKE